MHEENYRMVDQIELVHQAIDSYHDVFITSKLAIEDAEIPEEKKQEILKTFEHPYIECVLILEKDEEIHPETLKYVQRRGLDLVVCSEEEKRFRVIPKSVDAYKLVGRLAY